MHTFVVLYRPLKNEITDTLNDYIPNKKILEVTSSVQV